MSASVNNVDVVNATAATRRDNSGGDKRPLFTAAGFSRSTSAASSRFQPRVVDGDERRLSRVELSLSKYQRRAISKKPNEMKYSVSKLVRGKKNQDGEMEQCEGGVYVRVLK